MDLIDTPDTAGNTPEFTVSDLAGALKRTIEGAFGHVRVKGEVGRVVLARSGHLYFDLKDDKNVLSCMTWKGQLAGLDVRPEEGMEVVVSGRMTTSGFKSQYSLNALKVQVAGVGALMAMLEKRKAVLQAEGLFAAERKQALPFLPDIIGVVTSPQGAVIRDILHRLRDRFPRKVLVWPVAVQGKDCAPQVARAIAGFNAMTPGGALPRPDVLIVARGGGSIEDLWGFNEDAVARAAAASEIPVISAVGHETDTTLIDFVSDRRAPTPTAAAEMAVPVRLELMAGVDGFGRRASHAVRDAVTRRKQRVVDLSRALPRPSQLTDDAKQRLDYWSERLDAAMVARVQRGRLHLGDRAAPLRPQALLNRLRQARRELDRLLVRPASVQMAMDRGAKDLSGLSDRLGALAVRGLETRRAALDGLERMRETLGYRETLRRGYAVVRGDGAVITGTEAAKTARELEIEFADGRFSPNQSPPDSPKPRAKPKPAAKPPSEQGSLF